ncbi:efflux transporter outer membrane subunit [Roseateles sp. SL47]|uniref:efflux transporter outer membrane subunit n=1 Tax=Roseateles sp. SL47 TaxID=2995138 RepID=UPI002271A709|nr:efflux transporter outer membrane subunit [Roseateles sp. SL47]WAC74251.1 efflux transporter outer membrane subunit [Roseateles sp. SL47]
MPVALACLSSLLALAVTGCAVGPTYQAPAPQTAVQWQAPLPHRGSSDALRDWWSQFDDPSMTRLIGWAEARSTSLVQAWASIEKARATLTTDQAAGLPSLTGSASSTRSRSQLGGSATSLSTTSSVGLDASWELDLFGKLRRNNEAAAARIDARIADWHDARVSLAAEVADTYVQYRSCVLLAEAYERELVSQTATEKATADMVRAGLSASADGALARASLASARASAINQRASCALLVKSLVSLTGHDEPEVMTVLSAAHRGIPAPTGLRVTEVPADALRQRPDLASLERELAASSAEIGAAQADLYPSISLSGSIGRAHTSGASSYSTWSFGPSLSLPIFDAGKRRAAVTSAQASYNSAWAGYQAGVRTAVKEVEQALVNLDSAVQRADETHQAAEAYREYFNATEANWRAGTVSLLSLEEARRSALTAEINDVTLQQNRVSYWIALYKALGGGWTPDLPATDNTASALMPSAATTRQDKTSQ